MRFCLRYEFFKDTLEHCGTFLLACDEKDIEYHLFEEFDTDSVSFLHESNLRTLLDEGYVSEDIYRGALRLAVAFRALEDTELWTPAAVCYEPAWREILELADRVKVLVKKRESAHEFRPISFQM